MHCRLPLMHFRNSLRRLMQMFERHWPGVCLTFWREVKTGTGSLRERETPMFSGLKNLYGNVAMVRQVKEAQQLQGNQPNQQGGQFQSQQPRQGNFDVLTRGMRGGLGR